MSEVEQLETETTLEESAVLKEQRKEQWRLAVEAKLQPLIVEAARLRTIISTAKTNTK